MICNLSNDVLCEQAQAVCFLRPTRENIALLRRELREPHYGEYSLCKSQHGQPTSHFALGGQWRCHQAPLQHWAVQDATAALVAPDQACVQTCCLRTRCTCHVKPPYPCQGWLAGRPVCCGLTCVWPCAVFTNRVEDLRLQDLAEMDVRELISEVHEFFGDFSVLDPHHFCIPLPRPHVALQPFNFDFGNR